MVSIVDEPTPQPEPTPQQKIKATYRLATAAGYKFNITKIGQHSYDELAYYNKENFPDVLVTRPSANETDLSLLHTKCLMTVNGHVYPTHYADSKLYIPNATATMLRSRENNVGIISFNKLSSPLKKTFITPDMVTSESGLSMFEKTIVTFPADVGHPIIVIAGYMVFEHPEFFYRVSANSFVLRLDRIGIIEKLYELQRNRDIFKELDIPVSPNNPSVIDGTVARSDVTIVKLLTLFNSFLVEVPCGELEVKKIYLEHSNVPGNFRTEVDPTLPMIVGYGKVAEYHKRKNNDTKYTVYTSDAYYNNHLFSHMPPDQLNIYNDHRLPGSTYRLSEAFFLEISLTEPAV